MLDTGTDALTPRRNRKKKKMQSSFVEDVRFFSIVAIVGRLWRKMATVGRKMRRTEF